MSSQATQPSAVHYGASAPQQTTDDAQTWITRGANFVVCVSKVRAGATLQRPQQDDEYMVLLVDLPARIEAGDAHCDAAPETLTIVPPGNSRVTALADGCIVRVFSSRAEDLARAAGNAAVYASGAPEVAPLVPWPDPVGGYALRNYVLADHIQAGTNMRIFRSTNLMLNIMTPRMVARDVHKLSPHVHVDFEQGSLALSGEWQHHLRHPWGADMTTWRDDEHIRIGSPSLTVIPPKVIHTSNNINDGGAWLVDVFAPPRVDFSKVPGKVANADEYPMPAAA
jgi:mannose-6-phosphate isomerase-like protein (cupin superfamily)